MAWLPGWTSGRKQKACLTSTLASDTVLVASSTVQNYILNSRAFSCFLAEPGDVLLLHSSAASRKLLKLNSFLNSSTYSVMLYFRRLFLSSFPSARPAALEEEAWTEGVCRLEENLNRKQAQHYTSSKTCFQIHRLRVSFIGVGLSYLVPSNDNFNCQL